MMRHFWTVAAALLAAPAAAQEAPPLLDGQVAAAIAAETSGSAAKRTVQELSLHHRMRGSRGFDAAASVIERQLRGYGLAEVETIALRADGKTFYGTQRARPAWNASFRRIVGAAPRRCPLGRCPAHRLLGRPADHAGAGQRQRQRRGRAGRRRKR